MTVKELRRRLAAMPDDSLVVVPARYQAPLDGSRPPRVRPIKGARLEREHEDRVVVLWP